MACVDSFIFYNGGVYDYSGVSRFFGVFGGGTLCWISSLYIVYGVSGGFMIKLESLLKYWIIVASVIALVAIVYLWVVDPRVEYILVKQIRDLNVSEAFSLMVVFICFNKLINL